MNTLQWFEFNQNNSGGHFVVDDKGCHRVWIQAPSQEDAVEQAKSLGMYFNGVEAGFDCRCCGDRWNEPWRATELPVDYGENGTFETIEQYAQFLADRYGWTSPDGRLYYADGTVKEISADEQARAAYHAALKERYG